VTSWTSPASRGLAAALVVFGAAVAFAGAPRPAAAAPSETTSARPILPRSEIRLFNGRDLSGWYTFFPSRGVNSDPEKIITVGDGGVIRVTGKEFGYFATERSYANYRLSFEVRWGERRWPPRENAVRALEEALR